MEEILFGWVQDINNPLDLRVLGLKENIECKNNALKDKKLDLVTALALLNPDTYSKDLTYFRKAIFGVSKDYLKNFSSENLDKEFKSYLQSVISDEIIRDYYNKNDNHTISVSMSGDIFSCEYIRCNHNLKY